MLARSRGERTGVPSKAPQTLICALFLARKCWFTIIDIAPPTQLSFASGVSVGVQACRAASRKLWSWCRRRRVGVLSTVNSRSSSTAPGGGVTSWAAAHQHHSAAAHSGRVVPRMRDRFAALLRADRSSGSPFASAAPRPRSRTSSLRERCRISAHVYKESTVPPELCLDQNMIEYARAKLAVGKTLDSSRGRAREAARRCCAYAKA